MVDFNAIKDKWKAAWKQAKIGQANVDPAKPKFFIIWAYLTVSGFHHIGHMRGYSYTDAIARYKRMRGFNVLLAAGGHASGNSAVAKAQKVERSDPQTIAYYKEMGLSDNDLHTISTPEGFVRFFSEKYIRDYDEYGFLGDWRRFTVTTYPDYNKFIQWQFKKLQQKNLLVQKPYYATACVVHGPVAVDASESDISKGGNAEKQEYTIIKLGYGAFQDMPRYIAAATLRPETMFGQTNIWVDSAQEYAQVKVGNQVWIVSKECAQKLPFQKDDVQTIGAITGKELIGTYCDAPGIGRKIIILPSRFCDPDKGTGIVTSVPSDAPADWMGLHDLQQSPELCAQHGLDYMTIKNIQPIPIIDSKGFGTLPALEICKRLGITSQDDTQKLELAKKEIYKKGFHTGVMLQAAGKYAGMKVEEAKDKIKQELIASNQADIFHDLSEEVLCRCGAKVLIKRVEGQWFIRYSDEELTRRTIEHVKSMRILPAQFQENLPGVLAWFDDRACARQGTWLGTKLPFDPSYTVEPIADSTLYPIYYLVSHYVNEGLISSEQLTEEFFDYVFLGEGSAAHVAAATKLPQQIIDTVRAEVEYWYPLDINVGGKEHQTVHFPVFLMNHVGILPKKYHPQGIFVNWWVVGEGGKISKSKGGAKSIQDEGKTYSIDAIRLYYANIASPFVDIQFETDDLRTYRQRLERLFLVIEDILEMQHATPSRIDQWLISQWNRRLHNITANMENNEFKAVTDDIYVGVYKDIIWYRKRGGANKNILMTIARQWAITMGMFTPYVAEEINSMLGATDLVATAKFPVVDASLIQENIGYLEDLIEITNADIANVIALSKIQNPSQVTLFISESWKYRFFKQIGEEIARTKDGKTLMQTFLAAYPDHKEDVVKVIQRIIKNPVAPHVRNTLDEEYAAMVDAIPFFSASCNAPVTVVRADQSDHPKARQATPGKIAILVA